MLSEFINKYIGIKKSIFLHTKCQFVNTHCWVYHIKYLGDCTITIQTEFLILFFRVFFKRFYLFIFREGKGGRKRGRETSMCGCLLSTTPLGTWPATQACALTGNGTSDPSVRGQALNPLSHTSQGEFLTLINSRMIFFVRMT